MITPVDTLMEEELGLENFVKAMMELTGIPLAERRIFDRRAYQEENKTLFTIDIGQNQQHFLYIYIGNLYNKEASVTFLFHRKLRGPVTGTPAACADYLRECFNL